MKHKYLKNVATLSLEPSKCTGCGMCSTVCPHDVFTIKDGKAAVTDRDSCMECGACEKNCPLAAITVKTGVGCAAAVINGMLTGSEPTCGCSSDGDSGCCS